MTINYIHWNIKPEIINLFGVSIRYYGLFFVTGLILCTSILGWLFKKEGISKKNLEKLSTYSLIGIFAGARLGHCLFLNGLTPLQGIRHSYTKHFHIF